MTPASILSQVCDLLATDDAAAASQCLAAGYPSPTPQTKRSTWTPARSFPVFLRDRFTDRYFGEPLVFPGTLRALSLLLPRDFPYQKNWKQSETHLAFWQLTPTIDHVVPLARGGGDDEANAVTTSMLRNGAKANWLLYELGWPTERAPIAEKWDGLLSWFFVAYERFEVLRGDRAVQGWYRVAKQAKR